MMTNEFLLIHRKFKQKIVLFIAFLMKSLRVIFQEQVHHGAFGRETVGVGGVGGAGAEI